VLEVNDTQNGVGSQSRVGTVTLIAPAAQPVAQFPIALQSSRQLAGIPHANPAAPP
jgi:hypothetical protein